MLRVRNATGIDFGFPSVKVKFENYSAEELQMKHELTFSLPSHLEIAEGRAKAEAFLKRNESMKWKVGAFVMLTPPGEAGTYTITLSAIEADTFKWNVSRLGRVANLPELQQAYG